MYFLSEDVMQNTYFLVSREENIGKSIPRIYEIFKFNDNFELVSKIGPIENISYTEVLAPVYVRDNGDLFQLSTSKDGVKLTKWYKQ